MKRVVLASFICVVLALSNTHAEDSALAVFESLTDRPSIEQVAKLIKAMKAEMSIATLDEMREMSPHVLHVRFASIGEQLISSGHYPIRDMDGGVLNVPGRIVFPPVKMHWLRFCYDLCLLSAIDAVEGERRQTLLFHLKSRGSFVRNLLSYEICNDGHLDQDYWLPLACEYYLLTDNPYAKLDFDDELRKITSHLPETETSLSKRLSAWEASLGQAVGIPAIIAHSLWLCEHVAFKEVFPVEPPVEAFAGDNFLLAKFLNDFISRDFIAEIEEERHVFTVDFDNLTAEIKMQVIGVLLYNRYSTTPVAFKALSKYFSCFYNIGGKLCGIAPAKIEAMFSDLFIKQMYTQRCLQKYSNMDFGLKLLEEYEAPEGLFLGDFTPIGKQDTRIESDHVYPMAFSIIGATNSLSRGNYDCLQKDVSHHPSLLGDLDAFKWINRKYGMLQFNWKREPMKIGLEASYDFTTDGFQKYSGDKVHRFLRGTNGVTLFATHAEAVQRYFSPAIFYRFDKCVAKLYSVLIYSGVRDKGARFPVGILCIEPAEDAKVIEVEPMILHNSISAWYKKVLVMNGNYPWNLYEYSQSAEYKALKAISEARIDQIADEYPESYSKYAQWVNRIKKEEEDSPELKADIAEHQRIVASALKTAERCMEEIGALVNADKE